MPHNNNDETLDSIERKTQHDPCFTSIERDTVREIIRVYRGWVFIARVVRGGVVLLGGTAAAIASVRAIMGVML